MTRLDEIEKRRITAAVVGSVILHLLFAAAAGIALTQDLTVDEPETEPPPPVELTILRPEPTEVPRPEPRFLNTPDDLATETIPEVPVFESDKNTLAASGIPATGDAPLPTQEGLERPSLDLVTREYTPGELEPPQPALPPVPPVEMASLARPTPRPVEPAPEASPTPPPDAMPLAPPRPTPVPREEAVPEPTPVEKTVDAVPQPPAPPSLPTYQPRQERTRVEGNMDTRGRSSVDAVGTPLGRYQRHLSDAIGSRWNFYIADSMSLVSVGSVRIRFYVAADGSIQDLRILRNNSNDFFATRSVQAIMDAEIPPIPPDIAATLDQNRLEVEYNFTVYGR